MSDKTIKLVAGAILILLALFGRHFAWGGFGASRRENAVGMPTWLGRLLFVLGGIWFIYNALR